MLDQAKTDAQGAFAGSAKRKLFTGLLCVDLTKYGQNK
jgi:hypothetical protein